MNALKYLKFINEIMKKEQMYKMCSSMENRLLD